VRIRKSKSRRTSDRVTVNLASMIDVSFLLLFYFMVATSMKDNETRLSTSLQTQSPSATGTPSDFQTQNIEVGLVNAQPAYRLGAQVYKTKAELVSALSSSAISRTAGVFVKVSNDVPVGFAVAAVQAARDAGFEQVTYVATK
jgi:biopolymer transport protein ExbD